MSRFGNLMGVGAERYQRRYRSGGGMPWWQQMLIAEAAGPLVKGVSELVGEGTKQLFLGKHSQDLMEGQRGTDLINVMNESARIHKHLDRREVHMTGKSKNMYAGQTQHYKNAKQVDFEAKHGALSEGNNKVMFDNLWQTVLPDVQKVVTEDIRQFEEIRDRYKNVPQSMAELNRRREDSNGWWGKTTAGQVFARGRSFVTGIPIDEEINRSTQKLMLGNL